MDYNLKFKEEKEDKGIGIHLFLQIQMKKQYKKHSVILEKITYKYKTVKKWED